MASERGQARAAVDVIGAQVSLGTTTRIGIEGRPTDVLYCSAFTVGANGGNKA